MTRRWYVTGLLSLFILSAAGTGWGQEDRSATRSDSLLQGAAPDPVEAQADDVLRGIQDLILEYGAYQERLGAASSEDSLVLEIQLTGTQDRFMEAVDRLAGVIPQLDEQRHRELKSRAVSLFEGVTPRIFELIIRARNEIDGLRAQRTTAAAADITALEDRIGLKTKRLDRLYQYGWGHISKIEALGGDTSGERDEFAALVKTRADEISGRLELGLLRKGAVERRLKETPGDADNVQRLLAIRKSIDTNAASQGVVLAIMEGLKLPTHAYRAQLVTATQDLASGMLDHRVTVTLMARAWNGILAWMRENGPTLIVKMMLFLVILFVGRLLARLVRGIVERSLGRARVNLSQLLKRMIVNSSHNAVLALALMIALAQLGLSLGPLLAGFGVVGFILGFAMQDSLSNLAAGMMILINRPYDVGDLVEISGVFGKVEQMSMVSTSVLTLDNQKLVVPNSRIWGDVIKNVTDQRLRRVDLVFGISYSDDIPKTEGILREILAAHPKVLDEPEPMVRLHRLNESSVDFVVRPWVRTEDYWEVHWDVTRTVKMRFDEEGVCIPFPQRDVHVHADAPRIEPGS